MPFIRNLQDSPRAHVFLRQALESCDEATFQAGVQDLDSEKSWIMVRPIDRQRLAPINEAANGTTAVPAALTSLAVCRSEASIAGGILPEWRCPLQRGPLTACSLQAFFTIHQLSLHELPDCRTISLTFKFILKLSRVRQEAGSHWERRCAHGTLRLAGRSPAP